MPTRTIFLALLTELAYVAPVALLGWWMLALDDGGREAWIARLRDALRAVTLADTREWIRSPALEFARRRREAMVRGEWEVPASADPLDVTL